jgi:hypothetical protein
MFQLQRIQQVESMKVESLAMIYPASESKRIFPFPLLRQMIELYVFDDFCGGFLPEIRRIRIYRSAAMFVSRAFAE